MTNVSGLLSFSIQGVQAMFGLVCLTYLMSLSWTSALAQVVAGSRRTTTSGFHGPKLCNWVML
eukprot:11317736-Karenia_brevis.AAC.1